jgi:hypothetical protein
MDERYEPNHHYYRPTKLLLMGRTVIPSELLTGQLDLRSSESHL